MLFNSIEFILFFPIVTVLFYALAHKFRWTLLLVASCFFYMYFIPQYILILFTTILIDYFAGIWIEKSNNPKHKKRYLIYSVISTCLVLIIFKYVNFFQENMIWLSERFHFNYPKRMVDIILPIGLSFHTFQSLSYVIEVYRGNQKAEKHFGIYALYVLFYPQLVTGPIERPQNLLVQLREKKSLKYSNVIQGLRLILFGLFIKMVLADNIAIYVDEIFKNSFSYHSIEIITGLILYSLQIYCDFYGYSLIAIGSAKSMGYNLMDNFKAPYFSKSINEFWQRWHISLSTWFRDYVYISLGGNRVNIKKWIVNILIVFGLSGFWHGAKWTFILWGILHGLTFILENLITKHLTLKPSSILSKIYQPIKIIRTFIIVTLLWVLFRAVDLNQVYAIFWAIKHNWSIAFRMQLENWIVLLIIFFFVIDFNTRNSRFDLWLQTKKSWFRWSVYFILVFAILGLSSVNNYAFIYFQF
jgi:alginate O-acetyltransferase complex protein AlgI